MRRILMLGVVLSLVCGLWGGPTARADNTVQLCGIATGLADILILSGLDIDGGPFVMNTSWVEVVPTLYNLLGNLTFIRTPGDATTFTGGGSLTNSSTAFANNPFCAASSVLAVVPNTNVLTVSGTAEFRCVSGPSGPFTVTIAFTLTPCDDPGLFVAAVEAEDVSARQGSQEGSKLPAGLAPNEYHP